MGAAGAGFDAEDQRIKHQKPRRFAGSRRKVHTVAGRAKQEGSCSYQNRNSCGLRHQSLRRASVAMPDEKTDGAAGLGGYSVSLKNISSSFTATPPPLFVMCWRPSGSNP